jgi:hypothetical protein
MGLTPKMALAEAMESVGTTNATIGSCGWIREKTEALTGNDFDNQGLGSGGWVAKNFKAEVDRIIAKYSASVYLPAVQNFSDNLGVTPAVNDGSVGYVAGQSVGGELWSAATDATVAFVGESSRVSPSVYRIYSSAGAFSAVSSSAGFWTIGKSYLVNFTVDSVTTAGAGVIIDATGATAVTTTGFKSQVVTPIGNYISFKRAATACDIQISDISVRELGYIATQSNTTFKPVLKANGRPNYWLFDGTDDRLSLSGPPFQMADDHFVVACAKTNNGAITQQIFSQRGAGGIPVVGQLGFEATGKLQAYWRNDANTQIQAPTASASSVGVPVVGTARKTATNVSLRVNGVTQANPGVPTGSFTITNYGIGFEPVGAGHQFNGAIYCVIAGKGSITDAELLVLERYAATQGGLSI